MQLFMLKPWWNKHERFWVTFDKRDANCILEDERTIWAFHPTTRSFYNFIKNFILAIKVLTKERPDIIISTGAGVTVPFFLVGKLLKCELVFIEVFDRIDSATLTGKLVYPFTDRFLVQWERQKAFYPKAEYWGQIF